MRVTNNTYPDTLLRHLQRITNQMNSLQEQAATGQRITHISDDSAAGNRILDMQEEKGKLTQFSKNASRAQNINSTTISQVQNFIRISDRIGEISTLANDLTGKEGLQAYAEEVDELIELFHETCAATIEEIVQATSAGDRTLVASLAHRLKGGALNLGFGAVSDSAIALELVAKSGGETASLEESINELSNAYAVTVTALDQDRRGP